MPSPQHATRAWDTIARSGSIDDVLAAESDDEVRASPGWRSCFRVRRAIFAKHAVPLLGPGDLASIDLGSDDERAAVACAATLGARSALFALDPRSLSAWLDVHAAAWPEDPWLALSAGWLAAMSGGDPAMVKQCAEHAQRIARERRDGMLVIDAAALGALAAIEGGDPTVGLDLARRASRMASSEGVSPFAVLPHVVLARARRVTGYPHLAAHIVGAVAAYLAEDCRAWPDWEALLASGPALVRAARGPAERLRAVLVALERAERAELETSAGTLLTDDLPAFARIEAELLLEVLDAARPSHHAIEWCHGATDAPPAGLHGTAGAQDADAHVVARPGEPGRRVLSLGTELVVREHGALRIAAEEGQARTDSAIAALLLAGPEGMPRDVLFARLYGFAYHERHAGVFRVLLHRARKRVEGWATLDRTEGGIRIALERTVAFPDPRCQSSDRALFSVVVAAQGRVSARDLAEKLGVPLRSAQETLRRLAEAGLFRPLASGRVIEYVLEDTTFNEPTPP
jgi:hypothetical protein